MPLGSHNIADKFGIHNAVPNSLKPDRKKMPANGGITNSLGVHIFQPLLVEFCRCVRFEKTALDATAGFDNAF